jgi:hypothetical protein
MKFANPVFFWALLSLAVPVIIHLFHFRKFKIVYFTNVRFLKELRKETQSRSRLRHLLVLLARCLALAALVFAFAQPFIPVSKKTRTGDRAVSIYLDNSFSMDAQGESSSLFELAKLHALDIVASYKPSDRFQLITNDFEGKHQRLVTREQFSDLLNEVKPSPTSRKLSSVVERQKDVFKQNQINQGICYLISDFQKAAVDFSSLKSDTSLTLNCVHLKPQLSDNTAIDSCWFDSPYREKSIPDALQFQVSNYSSKRVENVPVKLSIDGTQRGLESLSLGPDSTLKTKVSFTTQTTGFHSGMVQLTDYPIVFDDALYFSYSVPDKIKVLTINGADESPYLNQLYSKNVAFSIKNVPDQQVDYSELANQQLIILNALQSISSGLAQELQKFVFNGGSLLVFPSLKADLLTYQSLSSILSVASFSAPITRSQKVASLNFENRIYTDVFERKSGEIDLPSVTNYLPFKASGKVSEDYLMRLQNGDLFLAHYDAGKGNVYLCAVPLEESSGNFPRHSIFIPTLYKIGLYSAPVSQLYYTIGREEPIELANVQLGADQTLKIAAESGNFEFIPEHRTIDGKIIIYVRNQIQQAGNYVIRQGEQVIAKVSFNYDRLESNPRRLSEEQLKNELDNAGWVGASILDGSAKELKQAVSQLDEGKPLWKLFIILALLFLLVEILLIRFLK